jgi:hypothetical protein
MRRFTFYLLVASMAGCGAEPAITGDAGIDAAVELDADITPTDGGDATPTEDAEVPDASEPPLCLTFDPPDEYGHDDDCDGAEGTRERSVYVSNEGDDTFAGSPNYPVRTLVRALELVDRTPSRKYVFVAASADAYDADGLGGLLERGVNVYGSLSVASGWARPEGPATTLTTTFSTDGDGVRAHVTDPRVELAFVRIVGRRAAGQRHSVGLTLTGQGTVDLSFVDVVTDDAMDGAPGADGIDAPPANAGAVNWADEDETYILMERRRGGAGGAVQTCPGMTSAQSQVTRGGKGGDGKACGSCAPEAGEDGGGGAPGGARGVHGDRSGKDGGAGAHGARGSDAGSLSFDDWSIVDGRIVWTEAASASRGDPGGGGGGGGGAQHDGSGCLDNRAPGGTGGGAGGCPGTAGEHGGSGGFSVGILALGAAPELHAVRIQTGRGGRGGDAGRGGLGSSGGTSPQSISVWCNNYTGGRGGFGGDGGDGGHGVPGGGGWTIGILGASPIESVDGVTFSLGAPGAAGASVTGGPTSADGLTHQVLVR